MRFQYKHAILTLRALLHSVVWSGIGTGLVRTQTAVHTSLDSLERGFIVAVWADQVGLQEGGKGREGWIEGGKDRGRGGEWMDGWREGRMGWMEEGQGGRRGTWPHTHLSPIIGCEE